CGVVGGGVGMGGGGIGEAVDMMVDRLDAPEAPAREHGGLEAGGGRRAFGGRRRNRYGGFGLRGEWHEGEGGGEQQGGTAHHLVSQRSCRPHIRTEQPGGITRSYTCA